MSVRVSIAIMAHPKRRDHVEGYMVPRLREQGCTPAVSWDTEGHGPAWNWRMAWGMRPVDSTHHVVLQDDTAFCADLPKACTRLSAVIPNQPISLFSNHAGVVKAFESGAMWWRTNLLWGVALMLPTAFECEMFSWISGMLAGYKSTGRPKYVATWRNHDDLPIEAFFRSKKILVCVPVPTLVDHIGHKLGGSIMRHGAHRAGQAFIGEGVHASGLDWDACKL